MKALGWAIFLCYNMVTTVACRLSGEVIVAFIISGTARIHLAKGCVDFVFLG